MEQAFIEVTKKQDEAYQAKFEGTRQALIKKSNSVISALTEQLREKEKVVKTQEEHIESLKLNVEMLREKVKMLKPEEK